MYEAEKKAEVLFKQYEKLKLKPLYQSAYQAASELIAARDPGLKPSQSEYQKLLRNLFLIERQYYNPEIQEYDFFTGEKLLEMIESRDSAWAQMKKEYSTFVKAYEAFLMKLKEHHLSREWKNCLELPKKPKKESKSQKNKEENEGGTSEKTVKNRSVPYKYRKKYQEQLRVVMNGSNTLEGDPQALHLSYGELKRNEGLYQTQSTNGQICRSMEEMCSDDWYLEKGYRCEINYGNLGTGKTIQGYRLIESILEKLPSGNWLIACSARWKTDEVGKESMRMLSNFINRRFEKKGKYVVIMEGLDELEMQDKLPRLFKAAKYYQATLVIFCRQHMEQEILFMGESVDRTWLMIETDKERDEERERILKENFPQTYDLIREVRKLPLYRAHTDMWFDRWMQKKAYGQEADCAFANPYLFLRAIYQLTISRECKKYCISQEKMIFIESFIKEAAIQLTQARGAAVSFAECLEVLKIEQTENRKESLSVELVEALLQMDYNLTDAFWNRRIVNFVNPWMQPYFAAEKIVDLCLDQESVRLEQLYLSHVINEDLACMVEWAQEKRTSRERSCIREQLDRMKEQAVS